MQRSATSRSSATGCSSTSGTGIVQSCAPQRLTAGAIFTFTTDTVESRRVHDRTLFTSESVTEGHPDKIADAISDAVLDAIIGDDPTASEIASEILSG